MSGLLHVHTANKEATPGLGGCLQEVKKIKIFEMSGQVVVTFAFERWLLTRALTGKILVFWIGGSK